MVTHHVLSHVHVQLLYFSLFISSYFNALRIWDKSVWACRLLWFLGHRQFLFIYFSSIFLSLSFCNTNVMSQSLGSWQCIFWFLCLNILTYLCPAARILKLKIWCRQANLGMAFPKGQEYFWLRLQTLIWISENWRKTSPTYKCQKEASYLQKEGSIFSLTIVCAKSAFCEAKDEKNECPTNVKFTHDQKCASFYCFVTRQRATALFFRFVAPEAKKKAGDQAREVRKKEGLLVV